MKIITANRLANGRVIYWTAAHGWTPHIADAAQFADEAHAESDLALAKADEATLVVAPHLIDFENGKPSGRERLMETIRFEGPTVGPSKGHGAEAG